MSQLSLIFHMLGLPALQGVLTEPSFRGINRNFLQGQNLPSGVLTETSFRGRTFLQGVLTETSFRGF
jgi:hypothetical protein